MTKTVILALLRTAFGILPRCIPPSLGRCRARHAILPIFSILAPMLVGCEQETGEAPLLSWEMPAQLDVRAAGERSVRITLKPLWFERDFPDTPALAARTYPAPALSIRSLDGPRSARVGNLLVELEPDPLTVSVTNADGDEIQRLVFEKNGTVTFATGDSPVLGLGEGGPLTPEGVDWREEPVEFDRRGRFHDMHPRWQNHAYGSRNPVPLMIGTDGWALYIPTPWGRIDLRDEQRGVYLPRDRTTLSSVAQTRESQHADRGQGIPPIDAMVPGVYDLFVFDAHDPAAFMKDVSELTGPAVLPPRWALGYMQSHRTLEDDAQMVEIVDTFREKEIPVDAVIYLGTGFTPRGWNREQPSFEYNPEIFQRSGPDVFSDLHERNVRVVLHMVPQDRDELPTLQGSIPPEPDDSVDASHVLTAWEPHEALMEDGVDGWWPDEGDWFNLFERMKRHQMYYEGSLSTRPNVRPWSLHRNGHLGVARWGGWVWSGDTDSAWKSLEAQIAVGMNHSLSLSPYWGSDIGGFFPTEELTGELYARWFQFGAFTPSFRSHGRTWWTRLPWGWGKSELGPLESNTPPLESELNNPDIEPVAKRYAELRYRLLPHNYTLMWEARDTGMPPMRTLWLHYPQDEEARGIHDQYLWGRDMLIAPVYEPGASARTVYLPEGTWYDWWTNEPASGGGYVEREVDLATMPIYVRAGAVIPLDPVRQYTDQEVEGPRTLRVYNGADGEYVLYEDDGTSLDYLEGASDRTRITWDDQERVLTIEPIGSEGIVTGAAERPFRVELLPEGESREVTYDGSAIEVRF